jgi:hypothetical protein
MDFKEKGWNDMDWINVAQDGPVAGSCEHDDEAPGSIKDGKFI